MVEPRPDKPRGEEIRVDLGTLVPHGEVIAMTPDRQLALWRALSEPSVLTEAQRRLGAMARGEIEPARDGEG